MVAMIQNYYSWKTTSLRSAHRSVCGRMSELVSALFVRWFTLVLVNKFFSPFLRHTWHHSQSLSKDISCCHCQSKFLLSRGFVLLCFYLGLGLCLPSFDLLSTFWGLHTAFTVSLQDFFKSLSIIAERGISFLSWTKWMRADSRLCFVFGSLALDNLKTFNSNYFRCVRLTSLLPGKKNIISIHQQILFS